jgi:zinc transport system ATP-binding protein
LISPEKIVTVENLNFSYGQVKVLKNVSFDINKGEFLAVIGPNGGGKSTLLKILLGILKPDSGKVSVFGKKPGTSRKIGYVPQDVSAGRGFPLTVREAAMMGRSLAKKGTTKIEDRMFVDKILDEMSLLAVADKKMDDLSGGQRQRVLMARALAIEPELLFLDEPASNVDMKGQTRIFDLLAELNKEITVVVISHDTAIIPKYATSVACVSGSVHKHDEAEITDDMINAAYGSVEGCPIELIAHGHPHRVLKEHKH